MTQYLRQSTAATLKIGPFVDDTGAALTSLTLSQGDIRLSKNGGNYAQKNESTSCTHDELGDYDCPIDTTDTNTLGRLKLLVGESGALLVWHEYTIIPADIYDTMFTANANRSGVIVSGTIGATGNSTTALHLTGLTYGDDEINDLMLVIKDVSTNERHARWITDWADTGDLATVATLPFTPENSVDTYEILAIRRDAAGAGGALLTSIPWNAAWDAEVQSEAIDALNAYGPPTKAELDSAVAPLATAAGVTAVETDTQNIQSRLPAALGGDGSIKATLMGVREQAWTGSAKPYTVTT